MVIVLLEMRTWDYGCLFVASNGEEDRVRCSHHGVPAPRTTAGRLSDVNVVFDRERRTVYSGSWPQMTEVPVRHRTEDGYFRYRRV